MSRNKETVVGKDGREIDSQKIDLIYRINKYDARNIQTYVGAPGILRKCYKWNISATGY